MANVSMRDKALELVHGLMYDQFAMVPTHTNMKNFAEGKDHGLIGGHYTVKVNFERRCGLNYTIDITVLTHTQEFINFCHEHGFSKPTCLFLNYHSSTNWSFDYVNGEYDIFTIAELNR